MRFLLTLARSAAFLESYHFGHDWEMVPGAWSFEIWYDGRKLTEQKLTVT
jgi:hypothetical protein